ncbi:MAG: DUF2442 domain-containing protein, partial [bacterium]|nr:DUF2442 domain-containing protein [bacterium]
MTNKTSYPCVENVQIHAGRRLLVTFRNGIKKVYDCSPLLQDEAFKPLANEAMFKAVRVDQGGYGISWNDEIDLSESELWIHGLPA